MAEVIPVDYAEKRIIELRGVNAIIGPDLAELYGVTLSTPPADYRYTSRRCTILTLMMTSTSSLTS